MCQIAQIIEWWCAVTGIGSSSLCTFKNGYPSCLPQYPTCLAEGLDLQAAENNLVSTDYAGSSPYFQLLQNWYCYPALDCSGQSLSRRDYNGQAFYGPISESQVTTHFKPDNKKIDSTLNSLAGGFGISSQADANNTVFVLLFAPNDACSYGSTNSVAPGKKSGGAYGFVWAEVALDDYANANKCGGGPMGTVSGGNLNLQSPEPIAPEQFATYASSHEIDEAITAPGNAGWLVDFGNGNAGQIADPCTDRTLNGNSLGYDGPALGNNWPYYNFARDSYGTVVAPFVQFSYSSESCYPDVSTSVPPG